MNGLLARGEAGAEIERIVGWLRSRLQDSRGAVVGISGGLDSDVAARLACRAVRTERVKLFTVIQDDMDPGHLENARRLAVELGLALAEIDLRGFPPRFVGAMAAADPDEEFDADGLLDPARAKCSLRTAIFSSYQDRGYVVIGTSNRTEYETGFFLPFGDGVWHVGPLIHLYKSEVVMLAEALGTRPAVLAQPPSAGFWAGQEDLEDLGYWLVNDGPIGRERDFSQEEQDRARRFTAALTIDRLDRALMMIGSGAAAGETAARSALPLEIAERLSNLVARAGILKRRPLGERLPDRAPI